jgi:preprotein translocase subunit SecE
MNIIQRTADYIKTSQQELKKVVWPTKKEVTQHTLMVIGISIGVAAFLGVIDFILNIVLSYVIK